MQDAQRVQRVGQQIVIEEIAVATNELSGVEKVFRFALKRVCAYTRAAVGHVFMSDRDAPDRLVTSGLWEGKNLERFQELRRARADLPVILCSGYDVLEQEERFAERAADPLKRWKLSPIDLKAREMYEEYGRARDAMFEATHTKHAPWFVVAFDDQRRGRLNLIRHLLDQVPDKTVPVKPLVLSPLPGKPKKEKFKGPVEPIKGKY